MKGILEVFNRPHINQHAYLEQTNEGQSLMAALATAHFGLKSQESAPLGEKSCDTFAWSLALLIRNSR